MSCKKFNKLDNRTKIKLLLEYNSKLCETVRAQERLIASMETQINYLKEILDSHGIVLINEKNMEQKKSKK